MKAPRHDDDTASKRPPAIRSISAVTLSTADMRRAVQFYETLGFRLRYGGGQSSFTSLAAGSNYLNLTAQSSDPKRSGWGRIIFYVSDVDAFYQHAIIHGLRPEAPPRDATWGERYFHISDPDGHELSFAAPLGCHPPVPRTAW